MVNDNQSSASGCRPRLKPAGRRVTLAGAAAGVTLVALALALYSRRISPELSSLSLADLTGFEFNPYWVGLVVQMMVVPVTFIYLFSNTPLFRRVVNDQTTPRDTFKLFAGLAAIQLLTQVYELWLARLIGEPPVFGSLIVVIAGGLLGGWRVGLGLGLFTMLFRGTQDFLVYTDVFSVYRAEGLRSVLDDVLRGHVFLWNYVTNLWASAAVWAGAVAGLGAELLAERRFAPVAALGLGAGIEGGTGYLTAIGGTPPGTLFLIPNMLVSGLFMAAIALMVRGVQADDARRKAEAAELARARAELRALRAQINPHFLFNALNTIRYFVRTDPGAARRLLLNLSEIFQRALRSGECVPLQDELSYIEAYLSLEKARLGERLRVKWAIRAEEWLDHPVPTLILQPVVENAVIHGIARKPEGGTVCITIEQAGDDLGLRVADDGPGIEPDRLAAILNPGPEREGQASIGLRNVDGRLRALYGEEYRLVVESEVGHGTCVQIRIPL